MSDSIWERIQPVVVHAAKTADEDDADGDVKEFTPKRFWRIVHALDVVALLCWVYIAGRMFVDWDRSLIEQVAPGYGWLSNFRFLAYAIFWILLWVVARKKFLLWASFIVLWPVLVIFWRFPWWIYQHGRWNVLVGFMHVLFSGLSGFRNILFGLAFFGAALLFLFLPGTWTAIVALGLATGCISLVLFNGVKAAFRPSRFMVRQRGMITKVADWSQAEKALEVMKSAQGTQGQLSRADSDLFLNGVGQTLIANRVCYFWSFRLNEYRKSPALIGFAALSVAWLFLCVAASLTVVNVATYQSDPASFDVDRPSAAAFTYYSLLSLVGNETNLVVAESDFAIVIRILAFIIGVLILASLVATIVLSYRYSRDDEEARRTITGLHDQATELDKRFSDQFEVTTQEALDHLRNLNYGLAGIVLYLSQQVPDGFGESPEPGAS